MRREQGEWVSERETANGGRGEKHDGERELEKGREEGFSKKKIWGKWHCFAHLDWVFNTGLGRKGDGPGRVLQI